jgi:hypothetical protein
VYSVKLEGRLARTTSGALSRFLPGRAAAVWALWKSLISLVGDLERNAPEAAASRNEIDQILADHAQDR